MRGSISLLGIVLPFTLASCHCPTSQSYSYDEKILFMHRISVLPMSGEQFADAELVKTIVTRDAQLLLALTPNDYEQFVGGADDEWTTGMVIRCATLVHELFEHDRSRAKAKRCFAAIGHPDIKMLVASKFLNLEEDTPEMTQLLKDALTSPEHYMLIASRDRNYDNLREAFEKRHGKLDLP